MAKSSSCWEWRGGVNSRGYGSFSFGGKGKSVLAHRWSYEHHRGPIPEGLTVDHLCSNKRCVNPTHLELVTIAENIRRAAQKITHCAKGHPLSGENLWRRSDGRRICRTCQKASNQASDARKLAGKPTWADLKAALEDAHAALDAAGIPLPQASRGGRT